MSRMSRFLSPTLSAVTPYTPGEQPQDQQYIKLNTNESPYLPSPAVLEAVSEAEVEKLRLYSDPACADLLQRQSTLGCSRIRSCPATAATRTSSSRSGRSATRAPAGLCGHHLWLLRRVVRATAHPQPHHPAEG